ncbi:hypothetical protein HPB48_011589 [Haemaphysalis longicornis]|uniref:Uncharacterized protein n=1 Tax=Haemaphysalis longicornis TaxID=44386 RepID=A0A9J6GUJ5_HAELO|nr:hypothetical protein HPB48_011589 [Haemaphysalis longicornis]
MRQLYEREKKLRPQKLLILPREEAECADTIEKRLACNFSVSVTEDDITSGHSEMDAIVYTAGYAAHSATKRLSCSICFRMLVIENHEIEVGNTAMIANLTR